MIAEQARTELVAALPYLRRVAHRMVANRADAEDLVQDAVVRTLGVIDLIERKDDASVCRYACRVLVNLVTDRSRRWRVRGRDPVPIDDALGIGVEPEQLQRVEYREVSRAVAAAVQGLSPTLRDALSLRLGGRDYQEVADHLGIPLNTAKTRLFRARQKLIEAAA